MHIFLPKLRVLCRAIILMSCWYFSSGTFCQEPYIIEKGSIASMPKEKKVIKILSIDGGGIRGIIPALILNAIEQRLKKKRHLTECFDVMSGTSTGGIIVLLLNTADENNKPKFSASDIVDIYQQLGSTVFYQSFLHRIIYFNGWLGEKYSEKNLVKYMEKYFENAELKDTLTEVLIPAYDVSKDRTIFFKTSKAKKNTARNFYFKDIARATSAAPTYFRPAIIKDIDQKKTYTLIDGGVSVNNPSLSAIIHALSLFNSSENLLIVSIGTGTNFGTTPGQLSFNNIDVERGGKIAWASEIVSMMIHAGNDVVNYHIQDAFVPNMVKKYYRLQVTLNSRHASLDDVSKKNIDALNKYANELIEKYDKELNDIANLLDS